MKNRNENYYAVIMAGGVGSRFWPVSTSQCPKQFLDIMGVGETLLQLTFNRLSTLVKHENILILTNEAYRDLVIEQLPKIEEDQIVLEPAMRNTAPCILLSALKIKEKNPNAVMLVAPSDHWIEDKEEFVKDIYNAYKAAENNDILITLGVKPTYANTGYGYIKYEETSVPDNEVNLQKVEKFTEKPTLRNARKYIEDGNYVWNSGIFIWKVSFIANSFAEHTKEMFELLNSGVKKLNTPEEAEFLKESYPKAQNISIDYAILEKSDKVYVIPASFGWDDLGTWGALYSKLAKDENRNSVVNAKLIPGDSKNNMIYSKDHKIVVMEGLEDFIIVDEDNVLMIVPREKEQQIKEIRAAAIEKFGDNLG